tara:strand:+ start:1473 stop:1592 length:120 start_codon:yes stop_codon:yes gene_type:complete
MFYDIHEDWIEHFNLVAEKRELYHEWILRKLKEERKEND